MADRHAYSPYTGNPYIHYWGVPFERQFHCESKKGQPRRTIIRSNESTAERLMNIQAMGQTTSNDMYALYRKKCN